MIKYILFDLDGVLVDACDWHYHSFNNALSDVISYKIPYDEHLNVYNGLPTKTKLSILEEKGIVDKSLFEDIFEKKQFYTKLIIEEFGCIDKDKVALHKYTKSLGIKSVCVTNSIRETASLMLSKTGQLDYMDFLVCNEDISKNKPDPMPFIFAIDKLQANKEQCLIVEDSEKGLIAAIKSGANVQRVDGVKDVNINNMKIWLKKYNEKI